MDWGKITEAILPILAGAVGGGGLVQLLSIRSSTRLTGANVEKACAEAGKTSVEAAETAVGTLLRTVTALQEEIARAKARIDALEKDMAESHLREIEYHTAISELTAQLGAERRRSSEFEERLKNAYVE